jgi:hypothetical protein
MAARIMKKPLTLTEFARLGGKARMATLSKAQRVELARKAGSAPKKAKKGK